MSSSWQLLCINSSYTLEVNILKGICTMQQYDKDRGAWTVLDLGQVQELRLSQISCLHIKRQESLQFTDTLALFCCYVLEWLSSY